VVGPRPRPRRTLAVILLDPILDAVAAAKALARRVGAGGLREDPRLLRGLLIASVAILIGTVLLVTVLTRGMDDLARFGADPAPDPNVAATPDLGTPGIGFTAAAPAPPPTPTPSQPGPPAAPPAPERPTATPSALAAQLTIEETTLLSYRAAVAINNPGTAQVSGWTLVVTLPRQTLTVTDVTGAEVRRDGAVWTFVPDQSTKQVRGGGSAQVRFRVDGTSIGATPSSCTINGRACESVPR
jgi:hypothetical protein